MSVLLLGAPAEIAQASRWKDFAPSFPYIFVPLVVLVVKKSCVMFSAAAVLIVARGATAADPPPFERTEIRETCANYTPLRNPYFGDLHVHTALSLDASTQGTRVALSDVSPELIRDKLLALL